MAVLLFFVDEISRTNALQKFHLNRVSVFDHLYYCVLHYCYFLFILWIFSNCLVIWNLPDLLGFVGYVGICGIRVIFQDLFEKCTGFAFKWFTPGTIPRGTVSDDISQGGQFSGWGQLYWVQFSARQSSRGQFLEGKFSGRQFCNSIRTQTLVSTCK